MASGSVTRRFLFSTSFLSLEHLWGMGTLVIGQARGMSFRDITTQSPCLFLGTGGTWLLTVPYLHRLSGMSSRLLLAAMNSSRLTSLPMPEGMPSKSSLLEFRYIFFSLVSLQMADWGRRRHWAEYMPSSMEVGAGHHE